MELTKTAKAVKPPKPAKPSRLSLSQKQAIKGLLFISPFVVGFMIFYLRSLVMTIQFSFSDIEVIDGGYSSTFVGFKHYIHALAEHASFKQDLVTSIMDMVVDVVLIIFFSLFMAILLNQKFRGRTLSRAVFFLPVILNSQAINTAITMARQMMMGGMSPVSADVAEAAAVGTVNVMYYVYMFSDLGLPIGLLDYVIGAVTRINSIITASGVQLIIFIAALQSIPPSLYEVAKIEGATPYETFWKVTFPMVSPLIVTNVVYSFVDSFINSSVVNLSYETIFRNLNFALGSVFSLLSMLVVCLLLFITVSIISKRTFYYN
ncbi:MAG: sugar ABC transporter permease [Oscillospiraceae bacterium]|nr:sugar ABC transporter permease [Oscillospiraceae bacterium]